MTRLVAAELLKLRTTRTFAAMVGATLRARCSCSSCCSLALDDNFNSPNDVRSLLSSRGPQRPLSCSCSGWWPGRASTGTGRSRRRCS